jgi:hypothetical protein
MSIIIQQLYHVYKSYSNIVFSPRRAPQKFVASARAPSALLRLTKNMHSCINAWVHA